MRSALRHLAIVGTFIALEVSLSSCGSASTQVPASPSAAANPTGGDPTVSEHSVEFRGTTYQYFLFSPTVCATQLCPALLLAHGAGGSGTDLVGVWKDFANQQGLVLVGPTLLLGDSQQTASTETIVPQLFPAIVEDTKHLARIDAHRVYLFGYSAGGYTVFDAAILASTYFAAGAVFAAVITPAYEGMVAQAQRKAPIALYLGDHDPFFSLLDGRRTRDLLNSHGFPVHYVELLNQDHNLATAAAFIRGDAWSFMAPYATP